MKYNTGAFPLVPSYHFWPRKNQCLRPSVRSLRFPPPCSRLLDKVASVELRDDPKGPGGGGGGGCEIEIALAAMPPGLERAVSVGDNGGGGDGGSVGRQGMALALMLDKKSAKCMLQRFPQVGWRSEGAE